MAQSTVFVGMDVHQDSVTIGVLPEDARECEEVRQLPHDLAKIRKLFARLSKRGTVRACYEASGCGYVLPRARRVLVESAWIYRYPPRSSPASGAWPAPRTTS